MEKNNKIILTVAIVLIPVFGILGWTLGSKFAEKESPVVDNKKQEEIEILSMEEAEKLIEKYHAYDYRQYKEGFTEKYKQEIALLNTEKYVENACNKIFKTELESAGDYNYYLILDKSEDEYEQCCYDNVPVYGYEDINNTYISLFGSKEDIPKTQFANEWVLYRYVEKVDSFVGVRYCYTGPDINLDIEFDNVLKVDVVDNQLVIDVQYVKFDSSTNSEGDNIFIIEELDSLVYLANDLLDEEGKAKDDVVAALFEEYAEQLPVYKYVFEKENDNLILVDFYKAEN